MPYLLNLVYLALIFVASPWLLYCAARKGKYRQGWAEKLFGRVPLRVGARRCVWWHAVSVGEVNLLPALVAEWQRQAADWDCVISTTTRTGYELARKRFPNHTVFYCPLDFTWATAAAMRRVRPDLLVLAELELWPNLVRAARRHGAEVAVVNGRLSDHSFRGYRRIRWLLKPTLNRIGLIAAQNQQYAQRFVRLGADPTRVHVTGSVKFDRAQTDRDQGATARLRRLWQLTDQQRVLLAGSTQHPEESMVIDAFRAVLAADPAWRLILVPRHPERFDEVAAQLRRSGLPWQRRSALERSGANPAARALLVDCVGELGAWWGTAEVGFVGGSMGRRGGQNMIEPAAYGVAVCFGPNIWNFRDIVAMLLEQRAAEIVHDQRQLNEFVRRCAEQPDFARRLGNAARQLVMHQQGATQKTVTLLRQCTPSLVAHNGASRRDAA